MFSSNDDWIWRGRLYTPSVEDNGDADLSLQERLGSMTYRISVQTLTSSREPMASRVSISRQSSEEKKPWKVVGDNSWH